MRGGAGGDHGGYGPPGKPERIKRGGGCLRPKSPLKKNLKFSDPPPPFVPPRVLRWRQIKPAMIRRSFFQTRQAARNFRIDRMERVETSA